MLGAGNVATHLSRHLLSAGHTITCVYSGSPRSSGALASQLDCAGTADPARVPKDSDFYIISVPDRAVPAVALEFRDRNGTWLHTAGALPLQVLEELHPRCGVLYPLQTLNKEHPVSLEDTPFLVEGSDPGVTEQIIRVASSISSNVRVMAYDSRLVVHLAAVFASNFSNHMMHIAEQILEDEGIDVNLLGPLLNETIAKVRSMGASAAQTGPALRGDQDTMQKHLKLLRNHPEWENLYTFISRDIGKLGKE